MRPVTLRHIAEGYAIAAADAEKHGRDPSHPSSIRTEMINQSVLLRYHAMAFDHAADKEAQS